MENTIILNSGQTVEVLFQDEVTLDIDCALRYIKSGEKEIASYVENTAKPQLNGLIDQAEKDMNEQITKGIEEAAEAAQEAAAEAIDKSVEESERRIEEYVAANITPDLNASAETASAAASSAETSAKAAAVSAAEAESSASASSSIVSEFDVHAAEKQSSFDLNALAKTETFDNNAAVKQALVDKAASAAEASAGEAASSAEKAAVSAQYAGSGNIGDIKYTSRTDVPCGGAWCNGALYLKAQYPDVYQMLIDGRLQSVPLDEYGLSVAESGSCAFFGLDAETESFKVPMLGNVYIKCGQTSGGFEAATLPNITGTATTITTQRTSNPSTAGALSFTYTGQGGGFMAMDYPSCTNTLTLDASAACSVYQDGADVNPDHVIYRAYVVLYSAAEETSSVITDYEVYNTVPLLTPLFHPEEIEDANWLKSAGQWNDGTLYSAVYEELVADYNNPASSEETVVIGDITLTCKKTPKKRKICLADQEANVNKIFAAQGIAWYYVLDMAACRFKLPRSQYGFVGSRGNSGEYVAESLPNITGGFSVTSGATADNRYGCFYDGEGITASRYGGTSAASFVTAFDAGKSNPAYSDGAPVQQRAVEAYLYFKAADATANARLVDIGGLLNAVAGKADADLHNIAPGADCIVESGLSGGIFWEKWKSGKLVQYGELAATASGQFTVSFAKPYVNAEYVLIRTQGVSNSTTGVTIHCLGYLSKTASGFTAYRPSQESATDWMAIGQGVIQ